MAACVVLELGPACVDIKGVRAGDYNLFTAHLHFGAVPLNLTGQTVTAQARKSALDPDPPALVAVCTIVDPLNGDITVRWDGDDVRTLLAGAKSWKGVWDLQVDNGTDDPQTLMAGKFEAQTDVTR